MKKMYGLGLSLVLGLAVLSGFQNCGEENADRLNVEADDDDVGDSASSQEQPFEVNISSLLEYEEGTHPPRVHKAWMEEEQGSAVIRIKWYAGKLWSGGRFKKFNMFANGRYLYTFECNGGTNCTRGMYISGFNLVPGQTYEFAVSGVLPSGRYTHINHPFEYTIPGTPPPPTEETEQPELGGAEEDPLDNLIVGTNYAQYGDFSTGVYRRDSESETCRVVEPSEHVTLVGRLAFIRLQEDAARRTCPE